MFNMIGWLIGQFITSYRAFMPRKRPGVRSHTADDILWYVCV